MNKSQRIKGSFSFQQKDYLVDIFGYCTKGVPGLDIVGLGPMGRVAKEKFVFLSRTQEVRLPVRRYVICLEENPLLKEACADDLRWLELPILILFWSLGDRLNFTKLEDCLASGIVSPGGRIISRIPCINGWEKNDYPESEVFKLISKQSPQSGEDHFLWFPIKDVFEGLKKMSFEQAGDHQIERARASSR